MKALIVPAVVLLFFTVFPFPVVGKGQYEYPAERGAGLDRTAEAPEDVSGKFSEAVGLYYDGEYEAALQLLRSLHGRHPDDRRISAELVRILSETGEYAEAVDLLRTAVSVFPDDPFYRVSLVRVLTLAGRSKDALAVDSAGLEDDRDFLFYRSLALRDEEKPDDALETLNRFLAEDTFFPLAHFYRGEILLALGEYEKAEAALNTALTQEPNLTTGFFPLARAKLGQGKTESAFGLLTRAKASIPWNRDIQAALEELEESRPDIPEMQKEEKRRRRQISVPPEVSPIREGRGEIPLVRIGLAEKTESIHVKAGGDFHISLYGRGEDTGGKLLHSGKKGDLLEFRAAGSGLELAGENGTVLLDTDLDVQIEYGSPESTTILFDVAYGSGYFFAGFEDRSYRGSMRFSPRSEGISIINTVNLEEYLYSTVPSEMPAYWPRAALEAQAVAARSYTMLGLGRYAHRGFDLLGSISSAFYQGVSREVKATTEAVDATRGKVLTSDGKLINAVYSANSGGYTESSESAWNFASALLAVPDGKVPLRTEPLPLHELSLWLEDRPDAYCATPGYFSRSAYRWKLLVPVEEVSARLDPEGELGHIQKMVTRGRGISGRVEKVDVYGSAGSRTVKYDYIRSRLGGLRSNMFFLEPKRGEDGQTEFFLFTGGGWGHGVGMDQSGAAGMAVDGFSSDQILLHFFPEAEISDRY